ncbi:MAG TPA: tellurite resistance TerB family protein [Gammaproteobacteria bacterium]|nr:tellurite resistance TerB family protein [Gammaproteobacteria bacterium]
MIDPKQLLEQVLGSPAAGNARNAGRDLLGRLDAAKGSQAFAGGAVAGGLLGLLLGGGRRRHGGGLLGYGGAAALGALALQAYQNYQRQQAGGGAGLLADVGAQALPHERPAADGSPFQLALVRAMVGAAKADGHIDANEQRRLFAEVERLGLDADAKAYIFDLLTHDVDLYDLARSATTPEQGAELYLAARLAIDPDEPAERAYLDALATRLGLPAELRATLDGTQQSKT